MTPLRLPLPGVSPSIPLSLLALAGLLASPPDAVRAQSAAQTDPGTLTVTSAADPGDGLCDATCTLRDAINAANADPAPNRVTFAIGSGAARIRLVAPLPALDDPATTIDGSTQPGYADRPLIYLDGSGIEDASGFVSRAAGIEFRALAVGGFDRFGFLAIGEEADDNRFLGNWAGLSPDGAGAAPNALSGIAVVAGPDNALIGDTCHRCGNRLAGNSVEGRTGHGILVGGAGTTGARLRANVVGLGPGGLPLPNDDGILIVDGAHATVGGSLPGEGNVVAASRVAGIELRDTSDLLSLRVEGNRVGLDEGGRPAPNDVGIFLNDGSGGIDIGGAIPGAGNVVAGNRVGIAIEDRAHDVRVLGNRIGIDPLGAPAPNSEDGVSLLGGATGIDVGGSADGEGNWIAGGVNGLIIADAATTDVRVLGNIFGRTPAGMTAGSDVAVLVLAGARIGVGAPGSGNTIVAAARAGVLLDGAAQVTVVGNGVGLLPGDIPLGNGVGLLLQAGAHDNTIEENRIGGNTGPGVEVRDDTSVRNRLSENVFLANGGLAIDLGGDGPTLNDPDDVDDGPNRLLNTPVIESLRYESRLRGGPDDLIATVEIRGAAGPRALVEVFRVGIDAHASGHGPGVEALATVRAAGDGSWSLRSQIPPGATVTALAIDSVGNTSELARNFTPELPAILHAGFTPAAWLAAETSVDTAVAPIASRIEAIFRFDSATQTWQVYRPGLPFLSSIETLHRGDALWLLLGPGSPLIWPQPDRVLGNRLLSLTAGLNFTAWTGDPAPVSGALTTIAAEIQAVFRWQPGVGAFQIVFPALPGLSPSPLLPGDVLWLRLARPADWIQPGLASDPPAGPDGQPPTEDASPDDDPPAPDDAPQSESGRAVAPR